MASIISQINWIGNGERADSVTLNRPLLEFLTKYETGIVSLTTSGLAVNVDASKIDAAVNHGDVVSLDASGNIVQASAALYNEVIGIIDTTYKKIYMSGLVPEDVTTVTEHEKYYLDSAVAGNMINTHTSPMPYLGFGVDANSNGTSNLFLKIAGTNAETLDGISSESFLRSDENALATGNYIFTGSNAITLSSLTPTIKLNDTNPGADDFYIQGQSNIFSVLTDTNDDGTADVPNPLEIRNTTSNGYLYGNEIITTANISGHTSTDADTLDGLDSTQFLRSDVDDVADGNITFNSYVTFNGIANIFNSETLHNDRLLVKGNGESSTNDSEILFNDANSSAYRGIRWTDTTNRFEVEDNSGNYYPIWHQGNDGSTSGLDADLLDGVQGAQYLRSDISDTYGSSSNDNKITFNIKSGRVIDDTAGSKSPIQVYQPSAGADSFIEYYVGGDYAVKMGLDGGINDIAVGGWSMGANSYRIWHDANATSREHNWTGRQYSAPLAIGTSGSITINMQSRNNFTTNTLTGSITLSASNIVDGQSGGIYIDRSASLHTIGLSGEWHADVNASGISERYVLLSYYTANSKIFYSVTNYS